VRHFRTAVTERAGVAAGLACLVALAAAVPASANITVSRSDGGAKVLVIGSSMSQLRGTLYERSMRLTVPPSLKPSQVKLAGGCTRTSATGVRCPLAPKNITKTVITFSAVAAAGSSLRLRSPRFRGHLRIVGGPGPDRLEVRTPRSPMRAITFQGSGGNDTLNLDSVSVSALSTTVKGGAGADKLFGSVGAGIPAPPGGVFGFSGADDIDGGAGNDVIVGRSGPDKIIGGTGSDTITVSGPRATVESIDGEADSVTCVGSDTAWFGDAIDTGASCPAPITALPQAPH